MAKQDYYELLGAARGSSADELKKAYRKLAMQYHPDRNPGDQEAERKFKEINEAYEVLKDDQKRAAYDQFGHAAFEGGAGRGPGDFDFSGSFSDIFESFFGDIMGGGGRRGGGPSGAQRGADLRYNLEVTLEEAFSGKQAKIKVPTAVPCEGCNGTGAAANSKPVACPTCQGRGKVRAQQGFFTIERTCPSCNGAGRIIENPCKECGGAGQTHREKTLQVQIPPGVEDGTRIRVSGEGEAGFRGGPPGDLYIFLSVAPHRLFKREGMHLYCRVPFKMTTASLGGSIEVPTIDGGRAKVTIPPGTQTGKQFRLKGKGMPALQGAGTGDLYVLANVETPVNLTKRQRELLEEFDAAGGDDTSPETSGFFARVKEMWDGMKG